MESDAGPAVERDRAAIVVFEHRDARGFLRLLRPGFRHCFCLLRHEAGWLLCDPLKGGLRLDLIPTYDVDHLLQHYRTLGRVAVAGPIRPAMAVAPIGVRPLTCVEIVKRALGLAAPTVLTPLQLLIRLKSTGNWA
jgi:hypothetical protein